MPQSPQKRWPGGFEAPHVGHPEASGVPQSPQNRLSAGFSLPQFGQVNRALQASKSEGTTPGRAEDGSTCHHAPRQGHGARV